MLRSGIIILLSALAGFCLTNVVMFGSLLRRLPRRELLLPEFLAVFFAGVMGKDYMTLLGEANIEPTRLDKVLYAVERVFKWSLIGSIVLVIIGMVAAATTSGPK